MKKIILLFSFLFLFSCSSGVQVHTSAADTDPANRPISDPWEPYNRAMFSFNMQVDKYFYRPLALGYRNAVPKPVRTGISNFSKNLRQPFYFINRLLQGEPDKAAEALASFFINTVFGLVGFLDVAGEAGVNHDDTSFVETLVVWGVPEGNYLVVPFLPYPFTVRDAFGYVSGPVINPFWWGFYFADTPILDIVSWSDFGLYTIDAREKSIELIDELQVSSVDFYATMREMYRQKLRYKKKTPDAVQPTNTYDFDMEDF